jgi:hypothetical protein
MSAPSGNHNHASIQVTDYGRAGFADGPSAGKYMPRVSGWKNSMAPELLSDLTNRHTPNMCITSSIVKAVLTRR